MSDRYARLIDEEVLPAIIANASVKAAYPNLKFTDDAEGRGTLGCSSGGAAAVIMGWLSRGAMTAEGRAFALFAKARAARPATP